MFKRLLRLWLYRRPVILAGIILLVFAAPLPAGMLGDAAPGLQVAKWIQGGPHDLSAGIGKTTYVIEFWSTECPHCLESLPYLSALQEQYKSDGVVFIGISSEEADTVRSFLKTNRDAVYALAVDDEDATYERFMDDFGISGVPHAFVIGRQGRILWEGHPMDGLDTVLELVVAGRYDLAKAQNAARARKLWSAYVFLSIETDENDLARQVGERVYSYSRDNPALLRKTARFILANQKDRQLDLELARRAARQACVVTGNTDRAALELYVRVLEQMGDKTLARAYQEKADSLISQESTDE